MEGVFSGIVKLDNVSDFIDTSQNCIVVSDKKLKKPKEVSSETVKISLQDCLACSGCVTTAETILLENQSTDEFLRKIKDPDITVVVSISSQSRAAIAIEYGLSPLQTMRGLVRFFRDLGVDFVFDLNPANNLSLIASSDEFIRRFQQAQNHQGLPILASSCPGWVCYVEKTHGELIPYLSQIRSAQATMGKLVKSQFYEKKKLCPNQCYHCTIMSCFDKKLEASRQAFLASDGVTPEVDSCLTTTELISLLKIQGVELAVSKEEEVWLDVIDGSKEPCTDVCGVSGSSGGLLEFVFREAAYRIFGKEIPHGPLPLKPIRNQNFQEVCLEDHDGNRLLTFAFVYGFRNIQTLVHKLRSKTCIYDYVEVMACPFGCLNGGGQPKPVNLPQLEEYHKEGVKIDVRSSQFLPEFKEISLETSFQKLEQNTLALIKDW